MDFQSIEPLAVMAMLVVLVLREAFRMMNNRDQKMANEIHEMWTWHAPDSDGMQAWKNKHMSEAIENMAQAIKEMAETNRKVAGAVNRMTDVLDRIDKEK